MRFETIDAPDGDRPAVDRQPAVPHLDPPEAHVFAHRLDAFAGGVAQLEEQGVELRGLRRPAAHLRDTGPEVDPRSLARLQHDRLLGGEDLSQVVGGVEQRASDHQLGRFVGLVHQLDVELELAGGVVVLERGASEEVGHAGLRHREQTDPALDARHAQHVLALEIAGIAPAMDPQSQGVGHGPQVVGDVELRRHLGALALADRPAVDPQCSRTRRPAHREGSSKSRRYEPTGLPSWGTRGHCASKG